MGSSAQRTISTVWDINHRLPSQVVRDGRTETYSYDSAGRVLTRTETDTTSQTVPYSTNGQTQTWTYSYNASGLLQSIDGPRTDVTDTTTFAYDANLDLLSITNALGHITKVLERDARGYPTKIENENGVQTHLTYDPRGQLTSRIVKSSQGDSTTSFTYDSARQLTRVTLPDGSFIQYEYDQAHRLVAIQNAAGDRIEYTLDNMGNITSEEVKDSGLVTRKALSRSFDEAARLIEVLGSSGQDRDITYDLNGNPQTISNALGQTIAQSFDALDRLITSTDPANNNTQYAYDPRDNITQVTDPRGVITSFVYDGFDRVIQETSSDAGTTNYVYDAAGNLTQSTDGRGVVTNYSYDALNRLIAVVYPASAGENISYSYDQGVSGIGRLSQILDESGSTSFTYDDRGNLLHETRVIGTQSYTTSYSYTLGDVVTSMTYPSGRVVDYSYDLAQRISGVASNSAGGTSAAVMSNISYAPFGGPLGWSYGNSVAQSYSYDMDYRLSSNVSAGVLKPDLWIFDS